jgi:hypothetical protein
MTETAFHELFPLGEDDAPYKKLTGDHVALGRFDGERIVKIAPEALTLLARQAFVDSAHLLRPGHLAQLRAILDDPAASANDRFVSVAGWGITAYLQTRRIRRLERSHEEIQVEETLVFDFLHGLGEAFRETIRPQELHRLIVEGAVRILDAHGGALYVTDRTGGKLTPAFISKGCPPLVDVPSNILQQAAANPIAL